MIARLITVKGKVQGVGFRFHTKMEAQKLGVTGTVKNQHDGTVMIWAEGESVQVDAFISWCKIGPAHARVDQLDILEVSPQGFVEFIILR